MKTIIVIAKNPKEGNWLKTLLSQRQYFLKILDRIENVEKEVKEIDCNTIILDLDSISMDNRTIRELTLQFPQIYFLCTSKDRFHPELKDAICYHIYACLNKPIDPDELLYWLRCIEDNDSDEPSNTGNI
ncbi:MAG: hypothetical protein KKE44_06250 [Proteobacteria bacterium]|nr:hypothetical protein [Pseudomonadota bacterium]MBU1582329.1 hypothetical protein [Pseudomonadota bacterium]MBU2455104.1 hypothetical protein [Pseudomonadota bacterium]